MTKDAFHRKFKYGFAFAFGMLLLLCVSVVHAQNAISDSIGTSVFPKRFSMGFDRSVNTYRWDMQGKYMYEADGWKAQAVDRFLRTIIKSERPSLKDENVFRFSLGKKLYSNLELVSAFSSFFFSDKLALGLNNVSSNTVAGGIQWAPYENALITPMFGYVFDRQQDILDRGFMYSGGASIREAFGDSRLFGDLFAQGEYISPRFSQEQRAGVELTTNLGSMSSNTINVTFRNSGRDYYLPPDSTISLLFGISNPIASRSERTVSFSDRASYELSRWISVAGAFDISDRRILNSQKYRRPVEETPAFDSEIREFRLNGNGMVRFRNDAGTSANFRFEFNERDESHVIEKFDGANPIAFARQSRLEEQKNNSMFQTQLALNLSQAVTGTDTVSVSGAAVKMEYNTPSASNFDDRDELFLLGNMRWTHRFTPNFLASISGDINVRHIVFISGERSANNSWNRVYRIAPSTETRYHDFVTINSGEVVGNYTVYDFEALNPDLQSFSLRQLTISDSTLFRMAGNYWFQMQVLLRFYEQGELHWSRFTVRPMHYFDERTAALSIIKILDQTTLSIGFRYFEQTRYKFVNTNKTKDAVLRSYGPASSVRIGLSSNLGLAIDGWYQFSEDVAHRVWKTPNISMNIYWNI